MEEVEYTPAALAFPIEESLVQVCRESFGVSLRAVVLTGSLARNEASYSWKDGQAILLSDVEAMVVLHDGSQLPSRHTTQSLCARAEQRLAAHGVRVHVSLSVVFAEYLRHLPPHIYSYELRACGLVLFGDLSLLEQIPSYAASELSTEDAWRLLSNRLIEQMEPTVEFPVWSACGDADGDTDGDAHGDAETLAGTVVRRYRSIKLCLDLATSLLLFVGHFDAGYRTRLRRLEEFAVTPGAQQLPISIHEFLPLVRLCTAAKLQPETVELGPAFEERVTRWAWEVWLWQLQRMTGTDASPNSAAEEMIRAFGRRQGGERLIRGWLYAVRRTGWLQSARYGPKWLSLFASGLTPRHAVYMAAYRWQLSRPGHISSGAVRHIQHLQAVCDLLPVDKTARAASAADVARQLAWNYQEFVMETRS